MDEMDKVCYIQNFINGSFQSPGGTFSSLNPANGEVVAQVPDSDASDVDLAVRAAVRAFKTWSELGLKQRSDLLLKVANVLESRMEQFAVLESREQGKPVWLARQLDIPRAVYNFRHFANTALSDLDTLVEFLIL